MKLVAAGELQMGCAPSDASCLPPEKPLHKVPVKTFCMDETEVTVRDYRRCAEERGCSTEGLTSCRELGTWGAAGKDNHPIVCVSWQQADAYCRWAGKRLPTEEEWEYAARGQDLRLFPWGDEPPGHQICWKRWQKAQAEGEKDQREGTCPVDGHASASSPFGVLDMTGNVWEWTASDYRDGYDAPPMPAERAIRGGFWGSNSLTEIRVSSRNRLKPSKRYDSLGFRCAK
jgi:sulfatase modifying factor 1